MAEKGLLNTLIKAVEILDAYEDREAFLTLDTLSTVTGFPKPTVFRIVQTFISCGWMVQDVQTKKYGLSFGLMKYGRIVTNRSNLISIFDPLMQQLRDELNESIVLSVLDPSGYHICIHVVNNNQFIQFAHRLGKRMPLYAGGTGRCMLAFSSQSFTKNYLDKTDLKPFTNNTVTDRVKLEQMIAQTRKDGYCISRGEVNENTESLSVPILSRSGDLIACMNIASLPREGDTAYYKKAIPLMKEAAKAAQNNEYM